MRINGAPEAFIDHINISIFWDNFVTCFIPAKCFGMNSYALAPQQAILERTRAIRQKIGPVPWKVTDLLQENNHILAIAPIKTPVPLRQPLIPTAPTGICPYYVEKKPSICSGTLPSGSNCSRHIEGNCVFKKGEDKK